MRTIYFNFGKISFKLFGIKAQHKKSLLICKHIKLAFNTGIDHIFLNNNYYYYLYLICHNLFIIQVSVEIKNKNRTIKYNFVNWQP